jgi:hypothetical protein
MSLCCPYIPPVTFAVSIPHSCRISVTPLGIKLCFLLSVSILAVYMYMHNIVEKHFIALNEIGTSDQCLMECKIYLKARIVTNARVRGLQGSPSDHSLSQWWFRPQTTVGQNIVQLSLLWDEVIAKCCRYTFNFWG